MAKYLVTLFEIGTTEPCAEFVTDSIPHEGLVLTHDGYEWEVVRVRQHIRDDGSRSTPNRAPHIVDVLVRHIDWFFTQNMDDGSRYFIVFDRPDGTRIAVAKVDFEREFRIMSRTPESDRLWLEWSGYNRRPGV